MIAGADGEVLSPGSMLGRYELLSPIAQGGMAAVWAARQSGAHGFRKTVAVKTMLPALTEDPQFERMFLAEGRTAMRVHHPNVVEILDLGEDRGVIYLVMEWLDGESLSMLMKVVEKTGQLVPLPLAVLIAARACKGLHAAHEVTDDDDLPLDLVHRDVSPQNVMVTFDGQVKVVDFGVAKSLGEGTGTQAGQFKGKVPYMSPEQIAGLPIDRRTDIFAMGSLIYRLTTGKHPFLEPGNEVATLRNIADQPFPPIASLIPDYPPALAAIINRCLSKSPGYRYPTMQALAGDLDALLPSLGPVSEVELGSFMKEKLSEVRAKRRAGMRDAAKNLGWASATSESNPRISGLPSLSMNGITGPHLVADPGSYGGLTPSTRSGGITSSSNTGAVAVLSQVTQPSATPPTGSRWLIAAGFGGALVLGGAAALFLALSRAPGGAPPSASADTAAKAASDTTSPAIVAFQPATVGASSPTPPPTTSAVAASASASAAPRVPVGPVPQIKPTATVTAAPTATQAPTSWGTGPDLGF